MYRFICRIPIIRGLRSLDMVLGISMPTVIPEHYVKQQYLPDEIADAVFYEPSENGYEKVIKERLEHLRNRPGEI